MFSVVGPTLVYAIYTTFTTNHMFNWDVENMTECMHNVVTELSRLAAGMYTSFSHAWLQQPGTAATALKYARQNEGVLWTCQSSLARDRHALRG